VPNHSEITGIASQAAQEQSFRRRVVDLIGGVLQSDVPLQLKTFVLVLLFLCLSASLVLTALIFDVVLALATKSTVHPALYAALLSAHGFLGVSLGFPLTMRMSSIQEAKRLEADFRKVQEVKELRARPTNSDDSDDN
jgi:hypothetical protein